MCGTPIQFDGMRGSIHRNDMSSRGWHVLETSQHIPDEEHGQLLLWADTIRAHTYRGCIPGGVCHRGPRDPGEHITRRCQAVHLEPGIDQHSACMA
jgi:hypothetical protein